MGNMPIDALNSSPYQPPAAPTGNARAPQASTAPAAAPSAAGALTPEALALIDKLKARDSVVRQHEQAHLAAAGALATSAPSYTYQRGPNGVDYAIGGEVRIDTSPGNTPEETLVRARAIAAAALAPADPSGPDLAIAAQAAQMELQAHAELAAKSADAASKDKDKLDRAYGQSSAAGRLIDLIA
jgi:hypothetical protein